MKQIYLPPQISLAIIAAVALAAGWFIISTVNALTPSQSQYIQQEL